MTPVTSESGEGSTGMPIGMQRRAAETTDRESIIAYAHCKAHHRHLSPLSPQRVLHGLRDWQAVGDDAGAVAGAG